MKRRARGGGGGHGLTLRPSRRTARMLTVLSVITVKASIISLSVGMTSPRERHLDQCKPFSGNSHFKMGEPSIRTCCVLAVKKGTVIIDVSIGICTSLSRSFPDSPPQVSEKVRATQKFKADMIKYGKKNHILEMILS